MRRAVRCKFDFISYVLFGSDAAYDDTTTRDSVFMGGGGDGGGGGGLSLQHNVVSSGLMPPPVNAVGMGSLRRPTVVLVGDGGEQQFTVTSPPPDTTFKPELVESECSRSSVEDDSLDRFPGSTDNSLDGITFGQATRASQMMYQRRSVRLPSMDVTEDSCSNMSMMGLPGGGGSLSFAAHLDTVMHSVPLGTLMETNDMSGQQQQQQQGTAIPSPHSMLGCELTAISLCINMAVSGETAAAIETMMHQQQDILLPTSPSTGVAPSIHAGALIPGGAAHEAAAIAAAVQLIPAAGAQTVAENQATATAMLTHSEETKKAVQDIILNAAAEILTGAPEPSLATQKTINTLISMRSPEMLVVANCSPPALQPTHFVAVAQPLPEKMEIGAIMIGGLAVGAGGGALGVASVGQSLVSDPAQQPVQQPMDTSAPLPMSAPIIPMVVTPATVGGVEESLADESRALPPELTSMTETELMNYICPNAFDSGNLKWMELRQERFRFRAAQQQKIYSIIA
ncbi:AGAP013287-PA-like protein [Anopheles sinensis]|uniref:AGAP013287-PA-like protein n=1 Tax=Anopheles sinensis TaxID=74873 RepID=A0A084VX42_ANOSI|nr:AGAP013287-PA-like protein [Anopheles sinensis]